jgi:hypothetical protein
MTDSTHSDDYAYGDVQPWVQKSTTQDNQRELYPVSADGKVGTTPDKDSAGPVGS